VAHTLAVEELASSAATSALRMWSLKKMSRAILYYPLLKHLFCGLQQEHLATATKGIENVRQV
jgi:hypothetical protein